MKKLTRSEFACNVTLLSVLAFTAIHLLIVTLNLFGSIKIRLPYVFDYLVAYILIIACLLLYIFGFSISKFKRVIFPAWLRILFYVAFFLFTNVYYILGLYDTVFGTIFFFGYIALLINILSVSIFYNVQKDDKNRLRTTNKFITLSIFCYSIAFSTFVQFVISFIRIIFFKNHTLTSLSTYVIEIFAMLVVNIALAIAFWLSLKKRKKFINACLIKNTTRVYVKRPIARKNNQNLSKDVVKDSKPAKKIDKPENLEEQSSKNSKSSEDKNVELENIKLDNSKGTEIKEN